ncbi:MAG: alpha-amylase family glycosyl hydrolase [Hadesarchaea archaeon]|nr:alpha-amylase family glycosyl hydrolase [Hadesarchaea archaeon]
MRKLKKLEGLGRDDLAISAAAIIVIIAVIVAFSVGAYLMLQGKPAPPKKYPYPGLSEWDRIQSEVSIPSWEEFEGQPFGEGDVIYAILTDRFFDGNLQNNNQGAGEYRPGNLEFYQGGDWQGIVEKLDYIENLGVTAIMISPPMLNKWLDRWGGSASYHGYWAKDYYSPDPHFGTLDELRELVSRAKDRGIVVILDAVPNHTADFLASDQLEYTDEKPAPPFDNVGWYHQKGSMQFPIPNREQEVTYDLCPPDYPALGLDDLAQEIPAVEHALNDAYKFWTENIGAAGYRFDAAKHVPLEYLASFQNALGVPTFGEVWEGDAYKLSDYQEYLWGMEDFPLYYAIEKVFVKEQSFDEISRVFRADGQYRDPGKLVTFIETHDTMRFLTLSGSWPKTRLALTLILTARGIPMLLYGMEQGILGDYPQNREVMPEWDQSRPLYLWLQRLCKMRKNHAPLRVGDQIELYKTSFVYAFRRVHEGKEILVVMNNSWDNRSVTLDLSLTNLSPGTTLINLLDTSENVEVKPDGKIDILLKANEAKVYATEVVEEFSPPAESPRVQIEYPLTMIRVHYDVGYGNNIQIRGSASPLSWVDGVEATWTENNWWVWRTRQMASGTSFTFAPLINDKIWPAENYVGKAGETIMVAPQYP